MDRSPSAVKKLFEESLQADRTTLPETYRSWFSAPWKRIYTLNVDDVDEVAQTRFNVPAMASTSALSDTYQDDPNRLLSVHLNGRVKDFPRVTFGSSEYGERTAAADLWYQRFTAEFQTSPFIFVGTRLAEPTLWHYVALRGLRRRNDIELRPVSYLVTPYLPAARKGVLESLNVVHIKLGVEEFADEVLTRLQPEQEQGRRILKSRRMPLSQRPILQPLSSLRRQPGPDPAEYLLGREPAWADITSGFAVQRQFETRLVEYVMHQGSGVLVITGTAGSGKSTTLMRLALNLDAAGRSVGVLDLGTEYALSAIRKEVVASKYDVIVLDDVHAIGESAGGLLTSLASDRKDLLFLCAVRSTRRRWMRSAPLEKPVPWGEWTVPLLGDEDIDRLLDSLDRANRLGKLLGLSRKEQVTRFRRVAGRQLLVAMVEATSGERFEEKIARECTELDPAEGLVYGLIALATSLGEHLNRNDVLLSTKEPNLETLGRIETLTKQGLITETAQGELRSRHRYIAEQSIAFYRRQNQLVQIVTSLLFTMAADNVPGTPIRNKQRRLLIRLMNHDYLYGIVSDIAKVRNVYGSVEEILRKDFHFWLQRGSAELAHGEITLAENFLDQARQLAPDAYIVQTAWAHMNLVQALKDVNATSAKPRAENAIRELEDVVNRHPVGTPNTYHVLGTWGMEWAKKAPLAPADKTNLLKRLLDTVEKGSIGDPQNVLLESLEKDLRREWLMTATSPAT
jgi:hypothetical protein